LERWCGSVEAEAAVCTHKDLVKIFRRQLGRLPLFALQVGLRFQAGEDEFCRLLAARAAEKSSR
jgi:hypothetical protein